MPKKPKVKEFNCQYDGTPWTEQDIGDLRGLLRDLFLEDDIVEKAAKYLCRAGTVDDVRRKAEELVWEGFRHRMKRLQRKLSTEEFKKEEAKEFKATEEVIAELRGQRDK
jgi:hypothetical protein